MINGLNSLPSIKNGGCLYLAAPVFYAIIQDRRIADEKLKVYLDTSVISYLDQQDAPEKKKVTQALWEELKTGKYEILVSDMVLDEINRCEKTKREFLYSMLDEIQLNHVQENDEANALAEAYSHAGGLPPKSKVDTVHIALAVINDCDIVLSWNFKHIVNLRATMAINSVNMRNGYKTLHIISPQIFLGEG
jgi:predicted nucleic acid-binding protein